ncbi:hypothetical protein [Vibrio europaeus]|uniref:Uncharacterized protein n=1 Tax=Vibrio europaeus TaxID=300876 RepID=A0ABT5GW28_9VIBR|nr:hypothetical protein [Vibrio europaeus]MDC5735585.1 hypothetical protein [Vibrio europaeus]MDC5741288.1 hypothetical protein [Vibrio europaeus]MDC5747092.1 hypothetical protein [Vibrio europaeus]MDC5772471.1 hypothetical protein [Vibrio europaeus]
MENWKTGKLENWKTGKLENWKTGKLEKVCRIGIKCKPLLITWSSSRASWGSLEVGRILNEIPCCFLRQSIG